MFSPTLAKEFDIKQDMGDITGPVEIQILKLNLFSQGITTAVTKVLYISIYMYLYSYMKIYTLTIKYSEMNGEVYEIEERIDEERTHYEIGGKSLEDIVDHEELMDILNYQGNEIAFG